MARILIIDDDALIRNSLSRCFAAMDHETISAEGLNEGIRQAKTGVDVIYLDLNLPDGDGRKAIHTLSSNPESPEIIVLTGQSDNFGAEETLTSGAWDYIQKPASPAKLRSSLESALSYRQQKQRVNTTAPAFKDSGILGKSQSIRRAKELMAKAAESEASVLILGETGVGKELTAKAIHSNSSRRSGPFVVVDCSNLTDSLLESILYGHLKGSFTGAHSEHKGLVAEADGGTLFLDEIGELPASLQKSFLRVLQEHLYRPLGATKELSSDFRLVAATNRNLDAMTETGSFRSDLLFRIRTLEINIPPLREREKDVFALADHFVETACRLYRLPSKSLSKQFLKVLNDYTWPGNVRELKNVMEAVVISAGREPVIYPKHLPGSIRVSSLGKQKAKRQNSKPESAPITDAPIQQYKDYKAMRDKAYFQQLMDICDFDITKASRISGLSVPSIYRHLGLAKIATKK